MNYLQSLAKATLFNPEISQKFAFDASVSASVASVASASASAKSAKAIPPNVELANQKPSQCAKCKSVWVPGLNVRVRIKYKKQKKQRKNRLLTYRCDFCKHRTVIDITSKDYKQEKPGTPRSLSKSSRKREKRKIKLPEKVTKKPTLTLVDFMDS